jgi:hypothetical protein
MGVSSQFHAPIALSRGKQLPVPIGEAGWAPEPVWTLWRKEKSLTPLGNQTVAVQPAAIPNSLSFFIQSMHLRKGKR